MGDLLWSLILAAVRLDPRILVRIAGAQSAPATCRAPVALLLGIWVILAFSPAFELRGAVGLVVRPGGASRIASRLWSAAVSPAQISAGPFQVILVVLAIPGARGLPTAAF